MSSSLGHYAAMGVEDPGSFMDFTKKGIHPFTDYLTNAMDALKNKEVNCRWERVEKDRFILKPLTKLYEIRPETLIELEPPEIGWFKVEPVGLMDGEDFDPDPEEPLRIGRGRNASKKELSAEDIRHTSTGLWQIRLDGFQNNGDLINWSGYELSLKPIANSLESNEHIFKLNGDSITSRRENESWRFWLQRDLPSGKPLEVNGLQCDYRVIRRFNKEDFQNRYPESFSAGHFWKVADKDKPQITCTKVDDITNNEMKRISTQDLEVNFISLTHEDWSINKGISKNERSLSYNGYDEGINLPGQIKHTDIPNWFFSCQKKKIGEKWIQLLEPEYEDESNPFGSILEYFFSDNVTLYDSAKKFDKSGQLHVLRRNYEEKQLLLSYKKNGSSEFPRNSDLHLKVDIGQISNQRHTAFQLLDYPLPEHRPLLDLFKPRDQHQWPLFEPEQENGIDWKVLTDSSFKGCDYQREFVCKALATPDFAIMSGPPGTGKTTTILELIIQLINRGKRVLLAASTHAAINNVLERLREKGYTERVHATRVGLEDKAVGLENFVFDRQVEEWMELLGLEENKTRKLVMESANLVCGTTMGIHSLLRNKRMDLDLERNGPPFDVMIIDECSKTTFQEFIVPARLAKHWILVGDIKQLSPFTDREQITANLDKLVLSRKKDSTQILSNALQEACKLLHILYPYKDKLIVPVSKKVVQELIKEIEARKNDAEYLNSKSLNDILVISKEFDLMNTRSLYDHNVIFIDQHLLVQYQNWMPEDSIILKKDWLQTAHAYRHFASNDWYSGHEYHHRRNIVQKADEIHNKILQSLDSSWSEELCWRLEREYWLRFISHDNGKLKGIQRQLKLLYPYSENATGRIYQLRNIAFPSVLESLSVSGMIKRRNDEPTTLTQGFSKKERECRHTTLSYQHRMHPDISELPRKLFYSSEKKAVSLLDGDRVCKDLNWNYNRYKEHRVWLDVEGKVDKNANEKEAEAIDKELEQFCRWAKQNPKDDQSPWEIAVLTFYKGQEKCLRNHLKKLTGDDKKHSRFEKDGVQIKLATVDFFQGQEADLVFLSMVNTYRDGFLDSPNRLNVAITRARYQLVIVGYHEYFAKRSSAELKELAIDSYRMGLHGN